VGLDLSDDTIAFFELENLAERDPPYAYISFKRIKLHIFIFGEKSEFLAVQELFKVSPSLQVYIFCEKKWMPHFLHILELSRLHYVVGSGFYAGDRPRLLFLYNNRS
jgi:hypothetical protein